MSGCITPSENPTPTPEKLILATTTSTYDSGLLDQLNPVFQEKYNCVVEVIAQGTGAAIATAKEGNADLILVHSREREDAFVAKGFGVHRRDVMYNDFVVVGPGSDPAGIKGTTDVAEAFKKIYEVKAPFYSRGDNSGTHAKEKSIWRAAGLEPSGEWYNSLGKGMGDTLTVANEKQGYTLADRGTYLRWKDKPGFDLKILVQGPLKGGDKRLMNPYGIIAVNPDKHPHVNYEMATAYIDFITSQEGQEIIKNYKVNGEQLFFPSE
jgi:tungstate transport system substrate-binding protein